jgi:hypothetical protein
LAQDYAPGDLAAVDSTELAHSEFYGLTRSRGFSVNTGNPSPREEDNNVFQEFSKERPNANYSTGGVYEFKPLKSGDHSFHLHIWPLQAISFIATSTTDCLSLDYEVRHKFAILSFIFPISSAFPSCSCRDDIVSPVPGDNIHYIVLIGAPSGPL